MSLPGHFEGEVAIEAARPLGAGVEVRVRLANGELDEAVLSAEDLARTCHAHPTMTEAVKEAALAVDKRAIHM